MFKKLRQSLHWSNAVRLYFDRRYDKFLEEMTIYSSSYNLTLYERVIVANSKLILGMNEEALNEFTQLALEIDEEIDSYLSLYCRASIADLQNNVNEYKRLANKAHFYMSKRYERTLPLYLES